MTDDKPTPVENFNRARYEERRRTGRRTTPQYDNFQRYIRWLDRGAIGARTKQEG